MKNNILKMNSARRIFKKMAKCTYQYGRYVLSPKIKMEGNLVKVSPEDSKHEYFFGYYDKSPWDMTDRYMLCMRAVNTWSTAAPKEAAELIIIDTKRKNKITVLAKTHAWNVQQGCMLQWLGPDYLNRIIYNDYRNNEFCSVIATLFFDDTEVKIQEEKIIPCPVYSVSADGTFALSLDFSRLHRLRPGYGYCNKKDVTEKERIPAGTCIWHINLLSAAIKPVLKYSDLVNFEPRVEMRDSEHKINHIMINTLGNRYMVLHRWFYGDQKYTRLITSNIDGSDMYNLSDDNMVSHCFWKNDKEILSYANKKQSGPGYYLMKDKTQEYIHCWETLTDDGHPSYSPNRKLIVTDTYPDYARIAKVKIMNGEEKINDIKVIAKVFAPFKYNGDTRCDLHPRWNHAGDKICIDSVFEGHRGLYVINLKEADFNDRV